MCTTKPAPTTFSAVPLLPPTYINNARSRLMPTQGFGIIGSHKLPVLFPLICRCILTSIPHEGGELSAIGVCFPCSLLIENHPGRRLVRKRNPKSPILLNPGIPYRPPPHFPTHSASDVGVLRWYPIAPSLIINFCFHHLLVLGYVAVQT